MFQGKDTSIWLRRNLPAIGVVLLGTVLLCLPAIWNGFPLVYSDTGAYLATAFEGKVPMGRPTGYGLFIRYTAFGDNVWLPLVAQSLLFAWLLWRTVRVVLPNANAYLSYGISTSVIIGLTGMSWYASQLMPDIFTGLVVLGFFVLLFDAGLRLIGKLAIMLALYWFCFSHYSHSALLLGLVMVFFLFAVVQWLRKRHRSFGFGRLALAVLPAALAVLTYYNVNYQNGFGWRMTRSSHVFTMARLSETRLLADYLHETCAEKHWSLCPYADALPSTAADFIWSDRSPFKKTGYWEYSRPGYDSLLADFFSRPKYIQGYLKEGAKAGLQQMAALSVGEGLTPYNESSSPYKFFERALPEKVPAYVASKQFEREFSFSIENKLLKGTMLLSILVLVVFWIWKGRQLTGAVIWFSIIAVLGYVMNAFLTGALANVYSRLQSRIAWMIPFAVCLMVMELIRRRGARL